ncbi:hypothetical protein SDJN02_15468 [Cucurbita argyrosperma subsp. argyrosperma]|nr:hypothetical protein SDJN02_15468 [Cucurbita argyrosperma subsp. argyrosperma]
MGFWFCLFGVKLRRKIHEKAMKMLKKEMKKLDFVLQGSFKKVQVDSETWDFGLARNEGELKEISPKVAYVVVEQ